MTALDLSTYSTTALTTQPHVRPPLEPPPRLNLTWSATTATKPSATPTAPRSRPAPAGAAGCSLPRLPDAPLYHTLLLDLRQR